MLYHLLCILSPYCVVCCRGSTAEDATQDVVNVQIPALRELCATGELSIDNIDVFCEKGVFDTDASRRILSTGKDAGWKLNFHGDELFPMNSGEVGTVSVVWRLSRVPHTHKVPGSIPGRNTFGIASTLLFFITSLQGNWVHMQ